MKHIMLCAFTLCLTFAPGKAGSLWEWQNPLPQGMTLNDVCVYGTSNAIAVGENATVIRTMDAGATWAVENYIAGLNMALYAVCFVDAATAVAVGVGGVIVRTADRGVTWNVQVSGTANTLGDVTFCDAMHGTAVGANGTILRTSDGGVTWNPQSSGTLVGLGGVSFAGADTGWVVGDDGTIFGTTDGGVNWTEQMRDSSVWLTSVHAVDGRTATAVGNKSQNPFGVGTSDGGATWVVQPMPTFSEYSDFVWLSSVCFTDANHGVAVGRHWIGGLINDVGIIIRTVNGGISWTWENEGWPANGVDMFDTNTGLMVGIWGQIMKTEDGGVTWTYIGGTTRGWGSWMTSVDFIDTQRGVAVATMDVEPIYPNPVAYLYTTSDGGTTWNLQTRVFVALYDVAFADADTVYAVGHGWYEWGKGAVILKSTDGGATWGLLLEVDCSTSCEMRRIWAVDFAGPNAGVAVGSGDKAITIQNGIPTIVSLPKAVSLDGVSMPTPTTVYAVGDDGVILKSVDSGDTWSEQISGTALDLRDVSFSDEMNGTAVGDSGTVLRTTDGGATWLPQMSGTIGNLYSVSFLSELVGVIGGVGTFLITKNGGASWLPEETPTSIKDIILIDLYNVTAVGGTDHIIARRGTSVPVFFREFDAHAADYSVELTWSVVSDEVIEGFRLYRRDSGSRAVTVTNNLIEREERSFTDRNVRPSIQYEYTLATVHADGSETRSYPVTVSLSPVALTLSQNYPNPFNPSTQIKFSLDRETRVVLSIYDISGRLVRTLVNRRMYSGRHSVSWDGTNSRGHRVASGIYFYRLTAEKRSLTKKMVVLK